jgi:ABC-type protease/lipase transport system fused ATPase/permease subunit
MNLFLEEGTTKHSRGATCASLKQNAIIILFSGLFSLLMLVATLYKEEIKGHIIPYSVQTLFVNPVECMLVFGSAFVVYFLIIIIIILPIIWSFFSLQKHIENSVEYIAKVTRKPTKHFDTTKRGTRYIVQYATFSGVGIIFAYVFSYYTLTNKLIYSWVRFGLDFYREILYVSFSILIILVILKCVSRFFSFLLSSPYVLYWYYGLVDWLSKKAMSTS